MARTFTAAGAPITTADVAEMTKRATRKITKRDRKTKHLHREVAELLDEQRDPIAKQSDRELRFRAKSASAVAADRAVEEQRRRFLAK